MASHAKRESSGTVRPDRYKLNPTKADTLIAELTRILVGEFAEMKTRVEQELRRSPAACEQQGQVIAAARLSRK